MPGTLTPVMKPERRRGAPDTGGEAQTGEGADGSTTCMPACSMSATMGWRRRVARLARREVQSTGIGDVDCGALDQGEAWKGQRRQGRGQDGAARMPVVMSAGPGGEDAGGEDDARRLLVCRSQAKLDVAKPVGAGDYKAGQGEAGKSEVGHGEAGDGVCRRGEAGCGGS
jgi:hypothetical protein